MKNYFLTFIFILVFLFQMQVPVLAVDSDDSLLFDVADQSGYNRNTNSFTLSQTVGQIIKIVLGLLGIIFLGLTVYAGFLWMTAAGEEEKVTKAVGILRMAVIGLIIVLAATSLTYFVLNKVFDATL